MPISKPPVDSATLPTLAAYEAAQKARSGLLGKQGVESRKELVTQQAALLKERDDLQSVVVTRNRDAAQAQSAKDRLTVEIDDAKSEALRLEEAIPNAEAVLIGIDADLRDLTREVDTATMSKLDLEAAYPALAKPVPERPPEIAAWIEKFQGITTNPDLSRSIHKTYFLAVSKLQEAAPKLREMQVQRAEVEAGIAADRKALAACRKEIEDKVAEARALKAALPQALDDVSAAEVRLGEIDGELAVLSAQLLGVDDATAVIRQMKTELDAALGTLSAKVEEVAAAVKTLSPGAEIPPLRQDPDSYTKRLDAEKAEIAFVAKSLGKDDMAFAIGRIGGLIDKVGQDVDAVNQALRAKLSTDRLPLIRADTRLRAEAVGNAPRDSGPVPADDLMIEDEVLAGLEAKLDEGQPISDLGDQIDARIAAKLKPILQARASAAAKEALRLQHEERQKAFNDIALLKANPAFAQLDPVKRDKIVLDEQWKAREGKATVASVTLKLQAALADQYAPDAAAWKTALGILGKSFPDSGRKYDGYSIHISFFPGNLSAEANGMLNLRKADGTAEDVDALMHDLFNREKPVSRIHATLETGDDKTPKVYYDNMGTAAPTTALYFYGDGQAAAKAALKAALVNYLTTVMRPKIQAFVDRHGRLT